eukprot:jgi/Botrbrau1/8130/Bobra.0308s0022.1
MSSYKPPPAGAHTFKPPRIIVRVNNEIQRRPFLAKTFACAAGFAFGDVLCQTSCFQDMPVKSWSRIQKMFVLGAVVAAPVQFAGLQWMDKNIMPNESHSKRAAIIKFTLDNVIGCTLWQAVMISIDQEYRRGAAKLFGLGP